MSQAKSESTNRRQVLKAAVALTASTAAVPAIAGVGQADAKLRQLWADYLAAMYTYDETRIPYEAAAAKVEAEVPIPPGVTPNWNKAWRKYRHDWECASMKHGHHALY